jgi:hypothetical protein
MHRQFAELPENLVAVTLLPTLLTNGKGGSKKPAMGFVCSVWSFRLDQFKGITMITWATLRKSQSSQPIVSVRAATKEEG